MVVQSGPLRLGGPELELQSVANRHSPTWTLLPELDNENLQPEEIRPLPRSFSPAARRPVDNPPEVSAGEIQRKV